MVNSFVITEKDVQEEEDSRSGVRKKVYSSKNDCSDFSKPTAKRMGDDLLLNISQSQSCERYVKDATAQRLLSLSTRIPKHLVALDENYLRRCLDLFHSSAPKDGTCNVLVNLTSSPNFQCLLPAIETGNIVQRHAGLWILDSIIGSKTIIQKDKDQTPIFCHFGALGGDAKHIRSNSHDVKGSAACDLTDSPNQQSVSSPIEMENEVPFQELPSSSRDSKHERLFSVVSMSSKRSDRSSSSPSATFSQGMLHCTWKAGMPHFVLSIDNQREILRADPMRVGSSSRVGSDWVYLFYSKRHASTEHVSHDNKPYLIGKMEVVTSMSLCQENVKIVQTEFVLFGGWETSPKEGLAMGVNHRKNTKLAKKVANVFRPSHSSKQRSMSGKSGILEDYSLESGEDLHKNLDMPGGLNIPEHLLPPNLELAAIVVKNHVGDIQDETGGWGLKFLKKNGVTRKINHPDACTSVCGNRDSSDCAVGVEVAVPAGLHGGPITRHGGPSSLIERWKSGGQCDCGGWDLGCPLTLLKARSSDGCILNTDCDEWDSKSFDLHMQGSEHCLPTLRMTDVRDGLYLIHFNSALSPLQSFSIAIARIHSQSRVLQSELYRS